MTEQQDFWKDKEWDQLVSNERWEIQASIHTKNLLAEFLSDVPREIDILDCGCNKGYAVGLLHELGFAHISGIDVNLNVIDFVRIRFPYDSFCVMPIEDLLKHEILEQNPYGLVLHMSTLMHVHPNNLKKAMTAIYNVSDRYIFGKELSSAPPKDMGEVNPDWKNQFWTRRWCNTWLWHFPDLHVVKKRILPMISSNNLETEVFLLEKPTDSKTIREREGSI